MKHIKWIIAGVVVIALIAMMFDKKGIPVKVAKVKKGLIKQYVEERAKTSLPHIYRLTMPLAGRIKPIDLKAGTPVKKGQVVASIDPADFNTNISRLTAEIDAIKSRIVVNEYNAIENTAITESIDWIKTMAELVKASQKKIEANRQVYTYSLQYETTLRASGEAVSRIKNSEAQKDTAVAKVETETAEINYNAMKLMDKIIKIWPTYIKQYISKKQLQKSVLEAELTAAVANLAKAKRDAKRTEIESPVAGVVLTRYVSNERYLLADARLLDVGNLDELEVTADILSQEVVDINIGNNVEIYGPAIGRQSISGKVIRVKPEGFTKLSSLGVEQQRVQVVIAIDADALKSLKAQGRKLGDRYRVQVKIFTASCADALIVPRSTVFKGDDGEWELYIVDKGIAILQKVKIGLMNDEEVQILKGITEQDKVVIAPPVALVNGSKVAL